MRFIIILIHFIFLLAPSIRVNHFSQEQFAAAYETGRVASSAVMIERQLMEAQRLLKEKDAAIEQARADRERMANELRQVDILAFDHGLL